MTKCSWQVGRGRRGIQGNPIHSWCNSRTWQTTHLNQRFLHGRIPSVGLIHLPKIKVIIFYNNTFCIWDDIDRRNCIPSSTNISILKTEVIILYDQWPPELVLISNSFRSILDEGICYIVSDMNWWQTAVRFASNRSYLCLIPTNFYCPRTTTQSCCKCSRFCLSVAIVQVINRAIDNFENVRSRFTSNRVIWNFQHIVQIWFLHSNQNSIANITLACWRFSCGI